uniref:Uncharacterized protein n=1 Tax=Candidatus Kentrum sp. SD TaxID=2126332 RepID=A0A450YSQ7_9GAMM|nr:MAG: hypothetical protein BECKSD772F_GA0070984_10406 [Candidatus Kentron sp. SD]VFK44568.1 MAG: hypothetical protein BECKSD772E_GA0070983_10406 [Candidatus Kentron sp. SD]
MPTLPVSPEESSAIVNQVIQMLREETGQEPDSEAVVDTLNQNAVLTYIDI